MDASRPSPPVSTLGGSRTQLRAGRLVVLMIAGVLALLCAGGGGVALVAYRDATEPDRSSPDVAVDNYLRAYFVDRNDARALEYACEKAELDDARRLREEIERRESQFGVQVKVTWDLRVQPQVGDRNEVEAVLVIEGLLNGQKQSGRRENWNFQLANDEGWRVCLARNN